MAHLGLVGAGVMGSALAENLAEKGHRVSVIDRDAEKAQAVAARAPGRLEACADWEGFVAALPAPRAILVLVPSGKPLDAVLEALAPRLEPGDVVADLGNSHWRDTEARIARLGERGIVFLGIGVSGGAEGARRGPAIMAGGPREGWDRIAAPLIDIAARYRGEPCADWYGPGGAGHFVKMVHNGIEYAFMQMIAEAYGLMRDGLEMAPAEIGDAFEAWRGGPLESFLVEIAAEVAKAMDPETGAPLLEVIADRAGQKGTGRWTVIEAMELGAPVSTISAAVEARNLSALTELRAAMAARIGAGDANPVGAELPQRDQALLLFEGALTAAKLVGYAQGVGVLAAGSDAQGWGLDLAAIARGWRAGCIIRTCLLDPMAEALAAAPKTDLLTSETFAPLLSQRLPGLQATVALAAARGFEAPAHAAALSHVTALARPRGTAEMIQALRDRFGRHGFERRDRPGESAHGPWADG